MANAIINLALLWGATIMGGLFAVWKIAEIFRDALFKFDVDVYSIRTGKFQTEKDWALQLGGKGDKKIRYFLIKKMTTTTDIDFDCFERVGRRDRITVVEKGPKQFTPVRKEFVEKLQTGELSPRDVDEIFALLPRQGKDQIEGLFDSADKIASKGFLSDSDPSKWDKNAIMLAIVFIAGICVSGFIQYKYMTEGIKSAGEFHRVNLEAYSRQVATDQTVRILLDWQKNGTIPQWAINQSTIVNPEAKPPDLVTMTGRVLNVG